MSVGYRAGESGSFLASKSSNKSVCSRFFAEIGIISAFSWPTFLANSVTETSLAANSDFETVSTLVTTKKTSCWPLICFAMYSSPAPISSLAGRHNTTASVASMFSFTIEFNLVPSAVLGLCIPGVSTTII